MDRIELLMQRRQMQAYIEADSSSFKLFRKTRVRTPAGGWKWSDPVALDPQPGRLIPFKRRMVDFVVSTTAGQTEKLPYVLVGYHDLDVQQGDTFSYNDAEFVVKEVDPNRDIRTAAMVDYIGGDSANE